MRYLYLILLYLAFMSSESFSQGGWTKITDPQNPISQYTTIYPYAGVAFTDVNNDNRPDIFFSINTFYINQGNGIFNIGTPLNYNPTLATSGSTWADFDNDGDIDCGISCVPSRVFTNNGNGTFTNITGMFPGMNNYGSWACAFGSLDNNKGLAIIFAHADGFHPPTTPSPCRFYFQPDTVFSIQQITDYPFTQTTFSYTNPFWSDYDLDGDMDLFIASGPASGTPDIDPCYKNMFIETGNDTLIKMTAELFATQPQDGQCYNFIDSDNDGDLDLCITNYFSAPTRFYQNNNGTYTNISTPFTNTASNLANNWGDFDNDGDLDVVITNGDNPTRYYRNNGNNNFTYLSNGFSTPTATNGIVNGDYDNDGDLDLVTNGIGNNGNTSSVGLFKNDTVAGNRSWVNIKLTGVNSNTFAIGAIVRLKATINGIPVWQMREVNAQNSFQGQNDLRVHCGFNNASVIDSLVIKWPKGSSDIYTSVSTNKFYSAIEGQGLNEITIGITPISNELPEKFILHQNYPNPFNPSTRIRFEIVNSGLVNLAVYDITGKLIASLINEEISPGVYENQFSAYNLPSGVYFYRLTQKGNSLTQKMLLIK